MNFKMGGMGGRGGGVWKGEFLMQVLGLVAKGLCVGVIATHNYSQPIPLM